MSVSYFFLLYCSQSFDTKRFWNNLMILKTAGACTITYPICHISLLKSNRCRTCFLWKLLDTICIVLYNYLQCKMCTNSCCLLFKREMCFSHGFQMRNMRYLSSFVSNEYCASQSPCTSKRSNEKEGNKKHLVQIKIKNKRQLVHTFTVFALALGYFRCVII